MEYRRFGDTFALRLDRGEEVMHCLEALCDAENIRFAQIDALGAADYALIGVYDIQTQVFLEEELQGLMEISGLTGNVTRNQGKVYLHLHGTLVDQSHQVHGGHIKSLRIGATCEMFVRVLEGEVGRIHDGETGLNLWKF